MKRRSSAVFSLLIALILGVAWGDQTAVVVRNAWIRESPPGVTMMAGYMELRNTTSRPQALVAASSSAFADVTIHRTVVKDGMAGMVPAPQVELAPNSTLMFAPGSWHLMLMDPKRTMRAGDPVVIHLKFRGNRVVPVTFEVRK